MSKRENDDTSDRLTVNGGRGTDGSPALEANFSDGSANQPIMDGSASGTSAPGSISVPVPPSPVRRRPRRT